MNAALMISRFAQFGGVMLLFGISLFRLRFNPESDGRICLRWYRQAPIAAAIITMASSLAWLDFVAGTMGDDGSKAASLRTIAAVLFHTRFGHVWQWNLVAAAIVLCATLTSAKIQHVKPWAAFVVGLSAFLIATSAWTGHAVMDNGLTGAIHPLVQVVHVLAAAAWLGSLPALGFALHSAA